MTSTSLTLSFRDVEAVRRETQAPQASRLGELSEALRQMTQAVAHDWDDLSPPLQRAFRDMAGVLREPPKVGLWQRIQFAYVALRAGPRVFTEYMDAVTRFRDALFRVIEREQRAFDRMANDEALIASANQGWQQREDGDVIPLSEAFGKLGQD